MGAILVTGATGFLGTQIVSELVTAGHRVRTIGRRPAEQIQLPEYQRCDLESATNLTPLLQGVDCIIHAAGLAHLFRPTPHDAHRFRKINVRATQNLFEAASRAGVSHFVFVSSMSVYGRQQTSDALTESQGCNPESEYARSKLEAEQYLLRRCAETCVTTTIVRPSTIYGAGDKGNILRLVKSIDSGRFVWIGSGQNRKSLIHVSDAAAGCVEIANAPQSCRGKTYNLTAASCSMNDIVSAICDCLHRPYPRIRIPANPCKIGLGLLSVSKSKSVISIKNTVEKWLSNDVLDGSLMRSELGFTPKVSLVDGMNDEVRWWLKISGQQATIK